MPICEMGFYLIQMDFIQRHTTNFIQWTMNRCGYVMGWLIRYILKNRLYAIWLCPRNGLYRLYTNSWWYFNREVGDKLINRQICWVCNFQTPQKYIICISSYVYIYIYLLLYCSQIQGTYPAEDWGEASNNDATLSYGQEAGSPTQRPDIAKPRPGWKVASHRTGPPFFVSGFWPDSKAD